MAVYTIMGDSTRLILAAPRARDRTSLALVLVLVLVLALHRAALRVQCTALDSLQCSASYYFLLCCLYCNVINQCVMERNVMPCNVMPCNGMEWYGAVCVLLRSVGH